MCFYIFHLSKAFRKYHFVLRGPVQNEENGISCRRYDRFWTTSGKSLEMLVDLRNPMPKRLRSIFSQLCLKHLGGSSMMELVMEALCLHWKLRAHFQRFSLVPPWGLSFWAKAIGFHLINLFGRCKSSNIFYQRNIKLMFAHVTNMCKPSNTFYEHNIKLVFARVNNKCKRSNIFFFTGACQRTLLAPPHPISNVASCWCANATARF